MTGEERVTYRSVLANREFSAILGSQALSILGDQIARIAIALLVFQRTGSAFAASATFAISYLTYLVGGPLLSALSDRYSRRTVMVVSDLGRAAAVAVLALAHLPIAGVFAVIAVAAAFAPAFDSARAATLPDLLPGESYVRGNALCNLVFQGAMVAGFLAGGGLVAGTSTRQALLLDAGTFLVSAGAMLGMLTSRPAASSPANTSLLRDTVEGMRVVFRDAQLRRLLGFALLSAAAVSAPESLAVPVASGLGGGAVAAGLLTASIPTGFILASFLVLRLPPERRTALLPGLLTLSVVPLMLTPFLPTVAGTALLWMLSGLGSSLQLVASSAYVSAAPAHVRARAYGLASTSLMAVQGLAQLASGLLATAGSKGTGPGWSVAAVALVILCLVPLIGRSGRFLHPSVQDISESVR